MGAVDRHLAREPSPAASRRRISTSDGPGSRGGRASNARPSRTKALILPGQFGDAAFGMTRLVPAWVGGQLQPAEKLEVHRRGLRHKAVSVFVMCDQNVLLQRRALTKYHTPGLWANTCCTHPLWDETGAACARRRLSEELGVTGLAPISRDVVEYRAEVGGGLIEHEVVEIFTAEAPPDLRVEPDPDEVMAVRWADLATLPGEVRARPRQYVPWLRIYLARHHEKIFGSGPGR